MKPAFLAMAARAQSGMPVFHPWALSSCLLWVDDINAPPTTSGGNLVSWTDQTSHANHVIPGGATAVPVDGTGVGTGAGAFLKTTSSVALGRFTMVAKVATTATGYIAFQSLGSSGGCYWYSTSPSTFIARSDGTQSASSSAFSAAVRAGTQVVAGLRFTGPVAGIELSIGGVVQTNNSASGTDLGTNTENGRVYIGGDSTGGGADNLVARYRAFGVFDDTISPSELAAVYAYVNTL